MKKILVILILSMPFVVMAKDSEKRVQKLNFEEQDVNGKIRQPDGSYIVQKRGVDFIPLYKLRENFDDQVEQSLEFVR